MNHDSYCLFKYILIQIILKFQRKFTISNHSSRHTCFHLNYWILNNISTHMPVSEGYLSLSWSIKAKQILSFWGFSFLFCVCTPFSLEICQAFALSCEIFPVQIRKRAYRIKSHCKIKFRCIFFLLLILLWFIERRKQRKA